MKVILLKDVKAQGKAGQVIEVADGYARNYLFPNNLAKPATATALNSIKISKEAEERRKKIEHDEAVELCKKLANVTVTVKIRTGANGKLFGALNTAAISEALAEMGYELDKKKIVLSDPIKALGRYVVQIKPYAEVSGKLHIEVVAAE
ncbi:MAG: 50S ribosomal protein L9 [Clostridiales bacterium]|nr:50S ribosomal protein L9 [Clostridiales bacterium]